MATTRPGLANSKRNRAQNQQERVRDSCHATRIEDRRPSDPHCVKHCTFVPIEITSKRYFLFEHGCGNGDGPRIPPCLSRRLPTNQPWSYCGQSSSDLLCVFVKHTSSGTSRSAVTGTRTKHCSSNPSPMRGKQLRKPPAWVIPQTMYPHETTHCVSGDTSPPRPSEKMFRNVRD